MLLESVRNGDNIVDVGLALFAESAKNDVNLTLDVSNRISVAYDDDEEDFLSPVYDNSLVANVI